MLAYQIRMVTEAIETEREGDGYTVTLLLRCGTRLADTALHNPIEGIMRVAFLQRDGTRKMGFIDITAIAAIELEA